MSKTETEKRPTMRRAIALAFSTVVACALLAAPSASALAADKSAPAAASPEAAAPPPPPPESMKVVPAGPEEVPSAAAGAKAPTKAKAHTAAHRKAAAPPEVEPANARLKIKQDSWIFSAPSKWSKHIMRAHTGKFINVTGTTRYYLQVKLKDGQTGYIAPADVDLVTPTDKVFQLTKDAPVLDAPNRWGKKVAEVHASRSAHVIGVSLNYMQIRMKNGLVGFIPTSALQ